jgi:hypothetical protein
MFTAPDRSEIGPYLGGCSSPERGSCYRLTKARGALGVGRFLRKRRSLHLPVLQHSKSPALQTDRSEIGPYLGGCLSPERGSCYRLAKARRALGVGGVAGSTSGCRADNSSRPTESLKGFP